MITNLNQTIQEAMSSKKWVPAKVNGKLTRTSPAKGWTIILEDGEYGTIIREPNSVGDFLIEVFGEKVRRNLCQGDVKGYIKS